MCCTPTHFREYASSSSWVKRTFGRKDSLEKTSKNSKFYRTLVKPGQRELGMSWLW